MNTADLVEQISTDHSVTKTDAKKIVDSVLKSVMDSAKKGEEVSFPGFGKFKVQDRPARTGRNPSTGAAMQIAASKKLVFQPAKAFKDSLAV